MGEYNHYRYLVCDGCGSYSIHPATDLCYECGHECQPMEESAYEERLNKREEVADDFIKLHGKDYFYSNNTTLSEVYHNLIAGLYGEVRCNESQCEIEIPASENRSGKPILYLWEAFEDDYI